MLNQEQIKFYQENGFLKIENWLSSQGRDRILMQISVLASAYPELVVTEKSKLEDGKYIPFQLSGFVKKSSWFREWLSDKNLNDELAQLIDEKCSLLLDSLKLKYPGGGDFHPHQDMQGPVIQYLNEELGKQHLSKITRLITFFVALDDHTLENGCLEIAQGEHKNGWLGTPGENLESPVVDQLKFTPLIMKSGDAVYFDGFLPHLSAVNKSSGTRRALFLFFNACSEGLHYEKALAFHGVQ